MRIIVLGAGMVGKAIAADLCEKFDVTSADIDKQALDFLHQKYQIKTEQIDLSNKQLLSNLLKNYEMVVCAVPGFMGYETLKTIITAKNIWRDDLENSCWIFSNLLWKNKENTSIKRLRIGEEHSSR